MNKTEKYVNRDFFKELCANCLETKVTLLLSVISSKIFKVVVFVVIGLF